MLCKSFDICFMFLQICFMFSLICQEISISSNIHAFPVGNCKWIVSLHISKFLQIAAPWGVFFFFSFFPVYCFDWLTFLSITAYLFRNQRARPIIIDPAFYLSKKSDLAVTSQKRTLPTAFKLFTGMFMSIFMYKFFPLFSSRNLNLN